VLTLGFFAAIVVATVLLGTLAGLLVFVALTAAAVWWILAGRRA
jgi:hypothetical protein